MTRLESWNKAYEELRAKHEETKPQKPFWAWERGVERQAEGLYRVEGSPNIYNVFEPSNLPTEKAHVSTWGVMQDIEGGSFSLGYDGPGQAVPVNVTNIDALDREGSKLRNGDKICVSGYWNGSEIMIGERDWIERFQLSQIDLLLMKLFHNRHIDLTSIKAFDQEMTGFYKSNLVNLIRTLRDAKRYLSSLYSSLPPICEEVNLVDFCLLEALKVFQVEIYNDIEENWWFYVESRSEGDALYSPFTLLGPKKDRDGQIRIHIDELLEKHVENVAKRENFQTILVTLFPLVNGAYQ